MTAETPEVPARPRLHRLERIFVRSPLYFVTTCTSRRQNILATTAVHESFVQFAEEGPTHGAWVGAYVLMPDHLHVFVALEDEKISLAPWMKSLKNTLSKTLRLRGVPAPHWQKAFFDHVLRSSESYAEKWHYVCDNPVRARLVEKAEEWPFAGQIFPLEYRSG